MEVLAKTLKHTAALAERRRAHTRQPSVVVLIYHRVGGGSGSPVDLPIEVFDAQMSWLAERAQVLTLDQAADHLNGAAAADLAQGRPAVVVTFDDGTEDFANAVEVLLRHALPATLYVATKFVEDGIPFAGDVPPASWALLRDALSTGCITIGSHTHSHVLLDRSAPSVVAGELDRSVGLIGERLGVTAKHFAYPKALGPRPEIERLVRERFATAALAGTRPNLAGRTDVHRLYRSPIQVTDGMRFFRAKAYGGLRLEDDVRRLANRMRYLGATS